MGEQESELKPREEPCLNSSMKAKLVQHPHEMRKLLHM